jgi:dUTP pyrophosphatase
MNTLFFKLRTPTARTPTKAHADDVGYDLYADQSLIIPPRDRKFVKTGLQIKVPSDCYGRIASRSGLSTKHKIDVAAGVVDKNYRGEIMVGLINSSDEPFHVEFGMKIAQLICELVRYPNLVQVDEMDSTDRENSGFGSSGI